jgi:hypothetical protein
MERFPDTTPTAVEKNKRGMARRKRTKEIRARAFKSL